MNCAYCGKYFQPRQENHRFCTIRCGNRYRKDGGISIAKTKDNQQKEFVQKMLGIEGSVYSFKVGGSK